ncbi:MAG: T9SS type A sorting domain-containing protein [Bacteroidota bacterium]
MKIQIALLSVAFLFVGTVLAQPPRHHGKMKAKHAEARKEVKAYLQKHVLPTLQAQRTKLDRSISSSDQAELEQIRTKLASHHEEAKGLHQELRKSKQAGTEPSQEQVDEMRELKKTRRLIMNEAWEVADAYEQEIYQLLDEIKPQAEQWKEEMKAIMEKYRPTDAPQRHPQGEGVQERQGHGMHKGKRGKHRNPLHHIMSSPVHFLLWDGEMKDMRDPMMDDQGSIRVFPNPGTGIQQLDYEVATKGRVVILLMDSQGNVAQTLLNEKKDPGAYSISVNLDELRPGTYFYQVTTETGRETQKIVVE